MNIPVIMGCYEITQYLAVVVCHLNNIDENGVDLAKLVPFDIAQQ